MIETDPGFDRTLPLALELSMQSRLFLPHEIVSGRYASPAPRSARESLPPPTKIARSKARFEFADPRHARDAARDRD
jgi:hypothetical protein